MKDKKEKKEKTKFNLAFDNLAIPEVHIGGTAHGQGTVEHKHPDADGEMEDEVNICGCCNSGGPYHKI